MTAEEIEEILDDLKRLAPAKRLAVIETALQRLREDLERVELLVSVENREQQLASAAEALYSDYAADAELRAFAALDGVVFIE